MAFISDVPVDVFQLFLSVSSLKSSSIFYCFVVVVVVAGAITVTVALAVASSIYAAVDAAIAVPWDVIFPISVTAMVTVSTTNSVAVVFVWLLVSLDIQTVKLNIRTKPLIVFVTTNVEYCFVTRRKRIGAAVLICGLTLFVYNRKPYMFSV